MTDYNPSLDGESGRCPGCGHKHARHNDLGYCQVFYRSVREYCGCGIVRAAESPDPRPLATCGSSESPKDPG